METNLISDGSSRCLAIHGNADFLEALRSRIATTVLLSMRLVQTR